MAKHRRKLAYLPFELDIPALALGSGLVAKANFAQAITGNRVFAVYCKGIWSWRLATAGEGPVEVGFAHSDYTAVEIEEAIENTSSWSSLDKVGAERARRLVRRAVKMDLLTVDGVVREGAPLFRKLGYWLEDGATMAGWVRNEDPDTMTTGMVARFSGYLAVRRT